MNYRLSSARRFVTVLTVALCLTPLLASAQGFKWWQSGRFQRELQLSAEQIEQIEATFQASLPDFRERKRTLDTLETELSRLIDASADEAAVMQQANRVEEVRSELSKARTRMLVRIRRVLTSDQRVRLAALHQEWERSRKDRRK